MRVMSLAKQGKIEGNPLHLVSKRTPKPRKNEITVKVNTCGVCRTDLHIIEGELKSKALPIVPGHQIVGTITEKGPHANRFRTGERIGITWINSSCGVCKFCTTGRENLCRHMRFTGWDVDGGYAEYVTVSQDFAYKIPDVFDDLHAAPLLCAGIIGYRGLKMLHLTEDDTLAIFGFGSSAHIITQVARHIGCDVIAFTRSKEHQKFAKRVGAKWAGDLDSKPPYKPTAAIITAPAGEIVNDALKTVDRGSPITIIDIHMSQIPKIDYDDLYYEKSIMGIANYTRKDAKEFLDIAAEIPIHTKVDKFKLEEANKAISLMKKSKINGSAVLCI